MEGRLRTLEAVQRAARLLLEPADPAEAESAVVRAVAGVVHASRARLHRWEAGRPPFAERGSHVEGRSGDLVVPLATGTEPPRAVVVARPGARRFGAEDVWVADRIAPFAAAALRSADRQREQEEVVRRLREVAHAKSEFLNLASHELRGPLTVLMGYLSLLEDGAFGAVPEAFASSMPLINARLAEMETLINAMLDTARLDGDQLRLDVTAVDLREVVDDAVRRCEIFVQAGQRVGLRCPDRPVPVRADRERMITVVANIVNNAIKYSVDGTDVTCALQVEGETATVAISDAGIGVAPEDLGTLFTRFGRVRSDPRVRGVPGTGLGLYLARELTRAHGGDVLVRSQPGVGSTFTVLLPLSGSAAPASG